ncbi:MAG: ATP-binding protein [Oligoflexia bacterium]
MIACLVAAMTTFVLGRFELHTLDAAFYNMRTTLGIHPAPDPRIVLVTLDDATLARFSELSPLSIRTHTMILDAIGRHQPLAIGYTVNLARSADLETEGERHPALRAFTDLARSLESKGLPVVLGTTYDASGETLPPFPLSTLSHGLAMIHREGGSLAGDKVSRRALLQLDTRPAFAPLLAQRAGLRSVHQSVRGSFEVPEIQAKYFSFRYHGNPRDAYLRIPAEDFLADEVTQRQAASKIAGKIVLIGSALRDEPSDFVVTPYSLEPWGSPKVSLHATILDSLLAEDGLIRTPKWVRDLTTFALTLGVALLILNFSPLGGVLMSLGVGMGFILMGTILFVARSGFWVSTAHPLIGMLAAYYLSVPYRLLNEHRQRSDLQRRNEVLLQVEELKTNFLSLVTHDLKTPVARIQGLAEVLLLKGASRLAQSDQQSLRTIIDSTEELNRFISSILELAKIESAKLKPQFESKDLNVIVERAISTFSALARAKGCRIETELEPLFPIQMDVSLLQKVINNLIDNALKYSPNGSTIRVQTREINGKVQFSVTDPGVGLSEEEQSLLFQKFYRVKNAQTQHVSGSGLGLYLCKFFVEAHSGSIELQSSPGQGSTFTLTLPQEQPGDTPGLRTVPARKNQSLEKQSHV